jgi:hypothetical protein
MSNAGDRVVELHLRELGSDADCLMLAKALAWPADYRPA